MKNVLFPFFSPILISFSVVILNCVLIHSAFVHCAKVSKPSWGILHLFPVCLQGTVCSDGTKISIILCWQLIYMMC